MPLGGEGRIRITGRGASPKRRLSLGGEGRIRITGRAASRKRRLSPGGEGRIRMTGRGASPERRPHLGGEGRIRVTRARSISGAEASRRRGAHPNNRARSISAAEASRRRRGAHPNDLARSIPGAEGASRRRGAHPSNRMNSIPGAGAASHNPDRTRLDDAGEDADARWRRRREPSRRALSPTGKTSSETVALASYREPSPKRRSDLLPFDMGGAQKRICAGS